MTAKDFLSRAIRIEYEINANMLEARRLRSLAEKVTGTYDSVRVLGSNQGSKVESAAIKLAELENSIVDDTYRLVTVKQEIRTAISALDKTEEKTVLKLRYLCGMKWEKIAVEMNYSWRQIHYLHKTALKNIAQYCTPNGAIL